MKMLYLICLNRGVAYRDTLNIKIELVCGQSKLLVIISIL